LHPVDEGFIIWTTITLSGLTGVVIPLIEPHHFTPRCPQSVHEPSSEQTASILGRLFYSYLDPLIAQSRRVAHVDVSMLPPPNDKDDIEALASRAERYFDPFTSRTGDPLDKPRPVNVIWAIIVSFRQTWLLQSFVVVFETVAQLGAPIGTYQLLAYIEAGGANAVVRPFVWVILLVLAPLVQGLAYQFYLSLTARWMVNVEAILTGVMFDHALRARILHRPATTTAATTDAASEGLADVSLQAAPETGDSLDISGEGMSAGPSAETATPVIPVELNPPSDQDNTNNARKAADSANDHLGRLNNLVTSDLYNIGEADQILAVLVEIPLMVVFSTWFLYTILGSATWVGLGIMVVFMPVPAWFGRRVNEVCRSAIEKVVNELMVS
jgi:ABC-type multidrug transport system fused ATPase/permease subunit